MIPCVPPMSLKKLSFSPLLHYPEFDFNFAVIWAMTPIPVFLQANNYRPFQ